VEPPATGPMINHYFEFRNFFMTRLHSCVYSGYE
jgi:hypothetical protein